MLTFETIKFCGSERRASLAFAGALDPAFVQHPAPAGRLVERRSEDSFMDILQLAKREILREPRDADIRIVQLSEPSQDRPGHNLGLVDCTTTGCAAERSQLD